MWFICHVNVTENHTWQLHSMEIIVWMCFLVNGMDLFFICCCHNDVLIMRITFFAIIIYNIWVCLALVRFVPFRLVSSRLVPSRRLNVGIHKIYSTIQKKMKDKMHINAIFAVDDAGWLFNRAKCRWYTLDHSTPHKIRVCNTCWFVFLFTKRTNNM